jgi:hypothetical protein
LGKANALEAAKSAVPQKIQNIPIRVIMTPWYFPLSKKLNTGGRKVNKKRPLADICGEKFSTEYKKTPFFIEKKAV